MPPPERPKTKIKITGRFTDELGGRLYAPGEWGVEPADATRLVEQGRATLVNPPAKAPAPDKKPTDPPVNPRIPPVKEQEEVVDTPLPEDFPSREVLVAAGLDTVEKLQAPDIKETLAAIKGLTPADVTKIGLTISKV